MKHKCIKCGAEDAHLVVLKDYDVDGGWIAEAYLCESCIDKVAEFMSGVAFKVDVKVPNVGGVKE